MEKVSCSLLFPLVQLLQLAIEEQHRPLALIDLQRFPYENEEIVTRFLRHFAQF